LFIKLLGRGQKQVHAKKKEKRTGLFLSGNGLARPSSGGGGDVVTKRRISGVGKRRLMVNEDGRNPITSVIVRTA